MDRHGERASHWRDLLSKLAAGVGSKVVAEARCSLERLVERSCRRPLEHSHVLLPFGGGKDSGFILAYLRLMQLLHRQWSETTFRLHVLFVVHPGVTFGVFENVEALFANLGILASTDVCVAALSLGGLPVRLKLDGMSEEIVSRFRQDVLIAGHLAQGNGRETFCNTCNFTMMNAVARYVVEGQGEIDFVVTGDSQPEALSYWRWVQRTSSKLGLERNGRDRASWAGLVGKLSEINDVYYKSLFGVESLEGSPYFFPDVGRELDHSPELFEVFGDTRYEYSAHSSFLESLGFRLREDSFNFTESDCRNPILMAHLRGLLADFEGRGYLAGVREYLRLVTHLMERKSYSPEMIALALAPYRDDAGILRRRREAERHAFDRYGILPPQLAAMVASPLTDDQERLDAWLRWCHPERMDLLGPLAGYLAALRQEPSPDSAEPPVEPTLAKFVAEAFGLDPRSLHLLLNRRSVSHEADRGCCQTELEVLRAGDPHQMKLEERPGRANNLITGR